MPYHRNPVMLATGPSPTLTRPNRILVTGSAGFVGYHLCMRLLDDGYLVTGLDGFDGVQDAALTQARHARLIGREGFAFHTIDIRDKDALTHSVRASGAQVLIHLAARAGVRAALDAPEAYVQTNLTGTFNVLEAARAAGVAHLIAASSSSIYGANAQLPFAEDQRTDAQVSLYAATKKGGEALAHSYASLWQLPVTMLRFFTVYGPYGRPDMAYYSFAKAMVEGRGIQLYNQGAQTRDFTYIDDITRAIAALMAHAPQGQQPYRVLNIGSGQRVALREFVAEVERAMGLSADIQLLEAQKGDVTDTWANCDALAKLVGFRPEISLASGLPLFARWFRDYHGIPAREGGHVA
ncbi:MAG: NAD-dependent epimerase/dehydratase family protein [Pseudomonadota bacterium]